MNENFMKIEHASLTNGDLNLLTDFYLQIPEGSITLITGGTVLEMNAISALLSGRADFEHARIVFGNSKAERSGSTRIFRDKIVELSDRNRLIPTVSIVDNFFICSNKKQPFWAKDKRNAAILKDLLDTYGVEVEIEQHVSEIDFLNQCKLQLLKHFYYGSPAIIWDKRKNFLANEEFEELFELMQVLAEKGMTFIVLDYSLYPNWNEADQIVIVRGGTTVFHEKLKHLSGAQMKFIEKDISERTSVSAAGHESISSNLVLELKDINTEYLSQVEFSLHEGEICAIFYENYESAVNLLQILNGEAEDYTGEVCLSGDVVSGGDRGKRAKQGVLAMESQRPESYVFGNLTVLEQFSLPKRLKYKGIWKQSRYSSYLKKILNRQSENNISDLKISDLSPGEILKLQLQAQILARPKVIVCSGFFYGADRKLQEEFLGILAELSELGVGIILMTRYEDIWSRSGFTRYELTSGGMLERSYEDEWYELEEY